MGWNSGAIIRTQRQSGGFDRKALCLPGNLLSGKSLTLRVATIQAGATENVTWGKGKSRKAYIVIFAQDEWQRMKTSFSSAAAYAPPPGVIEVVSQNWKDDYLTKVAEYEDLGILEYMIIDYAASGGIRFIGSPKQPTITIYQLDNGEYLPAKVFRDEERIESVLFPQIPLTAKQIFAMSC